MKTNSQQTIAATAGSDRAALYRQLQQEFSSLIEGETNWIANLANAAALLFLRLPDLNWAGFYLPSSSAQELIVGPFQGKPACVRIPFGKGVCGSAAQRRETIIVPDV